MTDIDRKDDVPPDLQKHGVRQGLVGHVLREPAEVDGQRKAIPTMAAFRELAAHVRAVRGRLGRSCDGETDGGKPSAETPSTTVDTPSTGRREDRTG